MADNSATRSDVILASLVGAAVGAGVAMLVAPKTGKETRDHLSTKARSAQERAKTGMDSMRNGVEGGLQKARDLKGNLRRKADETSEELQSGAEDVRAELAKRNRSSRTENNDISEEV